MTRCAPFLLLTLFLISCDRNEVAAPEGVTSPKVISLSHFRERPLHYRGLPLSNTLEAEPGQQITILQSFPKGLLVGDSSHLVFWNLDDDEVVDKVEGQHSFSPLEGWHGDEQVLRTWTTERDGVKRISPMGEAREWNDIRPAGANLVAGISPSGRYVAFASLRNHNRYRPRGIRRQQAVSPEDLASAFVVVVETETGEERLRIDGAPVCRFSPDESRYVCLSGSAPGEHRSLLKSYPLAGSESVGVHRPEHHALDLSFSPDGSRLAIGNTNRVSILETSTLAHHHEIEVRNDRFALASPTHLAVVRRGEVQVRDTSAELSRAADEAAWRKKYARLVEWVEEDHPRLFRQLERRVVEVEAPDATERGRLDLTIRSEATVEEIEQALEAARVQIISVSPRRSQITVETVEPRFDREAHEEQVDRLSSSGAFARVALMRRGNSRGGISGSVDF